MRIEYPYLVLLNATTHRYMRSDCVRHFSVIFDEYCQIRRTKNYQWHLFSVSLIYYEFYFSLPCVGFWEDVLQGICFAQY